MINCNALDITGLLSLRSISVFVCQPSIAVSTTSCQAHYSRSEPLYSVVPVTLHISLSGQDYQVFCRSVATHFIFSSIFCEETLLAVLLSVLRTFHWFYSCGFSFLMSSLNISPLNATVQTLIAQLVRLFQIAMTTHLDLLRTTVYVSFNCIFNPVITFLKSVLPPSIIETGRYERFVKVFFLAAILACFCSPSSGAFLHNTDNNLLLQPLQLAPKLFYLLEKMLFSIFNSS